MEWKRTKLTVNRWTACGFRITETADIDGRPFTLESIGDDNQEPVAFESLDAAKVHAEVLNELAVIREDNARLREQLDLARQGNQFERQAHAANLADEGDSLDYNPHADASKLVDADEAAWPDGEDNEIDPFCGMDLGPDGRGVPKLQSALFVVNAIESGVATRSIADQIGHSNSNMIDTRYGSHTRHKAAHVSNVASEINAKRKRAGGKDGAK